MSTLHTALTLFANRNMHLCLYGAFGATLLFRSFLATREHQYYVAREDGVIGLVHIMMALL